MNFIVLKKVFEKDLYTNMSEVILSAGNKNISRWLWWTIAHTHRKCRVTAIEQIDCFCTLSPVSHSSPSTHFIVQKKIGNHLPSSIEWPKRKVINLSQKNLSKKFIAPPSGAIKRREPVHIHPIQVHLRKTLQKIYTATHPLLHLPPTI